MKININNRLDKYFLKNILRKYNAEIDIILGLILAFGILKIIENHIQLGATLIVISIFMETANIILLKNQAVDANN